MEINLEVRSEILRFSLMMEQSVNKVLLLNLGIFDDSNTTRLFGSKMGLTFKNKIDLLYDINILSKEENQELELLMIFRNKFLHEIDCNSYLSVLQQMDNGLKNKFKVFLNKGDSINSEASCKAACLNLITKNIKTLYNKVEAKRLKLEERNEIFLIQNQQVVCYIELFYDLIDELLLEIENCELEDAKVRTLAELISGICQKYLKKHDDDETINSINAKIKLFVSDPEKLKGYFGVVTKESNEITNHFVSEEFTNKVAELRQKSTWNT